MASRLNLGATPVYGNQLGAAVNLGQTGYALAGADAGGEFYWKIFGPLA